MQLERWYGLRFIIFLHEKLWLIFEIVLLENLKLISISFIIQQFLRLEIHICIWFILFSKKRDYHVVVIYVCVWVHEKLLLQLLENRDIVNSGLLVLPLVFVFNWFTKSHWLRHKWIKINCLRRILIIVFFTFFGVWVNELLIFEIEFKHHRIFIFFLHVWIEVWRQFFGFRLWPVNSWSDKLREIFNPTTFLQSFQITFFHSCTLYLVRLFIKSIDRNLASSSFLWPCFFQTLSLLGNLHYFISKLFFTFLIV